MKSQNKKQLLQKFGKILKDSRKKKKMTQIELAEALRVSQSALSKMENGLAEPLLSTWVEMCSLLKISSDSITKR